MKMAVCKLSFTLLIILFAFNSAIAQEWPKDTEEDVPIYLRTLMNLHRGPPDTENVKGRSLPAQIKTSWIEQKLDHFIESDKRTWQMRYMSNNAYFKPNGPLFIYVGGEWNITESAGMIIDSHYVDMAKEHNGYLFYTEHRFYGESWPTNDTSLENLKYLHVKQALADLAYFIRTMKSSVPEMKQSKVIIAGCSYSATMVVWFKRLYPELVAGGWASSAPLLAKLDFPEYHKDSGRSFKVVGGQQCYDRIKNGISELEWMLDNNRAAEVKARLNLCNDFDENNELDVWNLFSSISNIFASYSQNGHSEKLCQYLKSYDNDLSAIIGIVNPRSASSYSYCNQMKYKQTTNYLTHTADIFNTARQWIYQTCNEYGWFQSSHQPFGTKSPVAYSLRICQDHFDSSFTEERIKEKIAQTNKDFGGLEPEVTNIYHTHGDLDPWKSIGLTELQGATIIPYAAHCADFASINATEDSVEMRASKLRLAALVREWLA